jgi:hypothetical protein
MEPFIFRKREVLPVDTGIRELTDGEIDCVAGGGETTVNWETSTNGGPWVPDGTSKDWTSSEQVIG